MNKIIIIVLFAIIANVYSVSASNDISFSKINSDEGFMVQSVMSIYQDELGSLWFVTREGVNRYNGTSMEQLSAINNANSLGSNSILRVCGNRRGLVFFQTQNGINQYDLKTGMNKKIQNEKANTISFGKNKLWIAEGTKIFSFSNSVKEYFGNIDCNSPITRMLETSDNRLLVGTVSSGLYEFGQDKKSKILLENTSQISDIYEDSRKSIWVATFKNGLYNISKNGGITNLLYNANKPTTSISSNFVRTLCEDNSGCLWIGTNVGLDKLSISTGLINHYNAEVSDSYHLSNESVWSLLKDFQGNIWVGTFYGGANYFNPDVNFFSFYDFQNGVFKNKNFPIIDYILEDQNRKLYLCTEGRGLIIYDPIKKTYTDFRNTDNKVNGLNNNNIKTGYIDEKNQELWLGTKLGGMYKLNLKTFKFVGYKINNLLSDEANVVRAIVPYNNNFLIATYGGLYLFDKQTCKFSIFSQELNKIVRYCIDLKLDNKNNIWIAGINGVHRYNILTKKCDSYINNPNNTKSLSNNYVNKILIDRKGKVWLATNGGGLNLFNERTNDFRIINTGNSNLKNNYISNIIESKSGHLIITTNRGFSIFDIEENTIQNFGIENGVPLKSLYSGGLLQAQNGEVFLGGLNGFMSFYEKDLRLPQKRFQLFFSKIWVNDKPVIPNDESGILKFTLPFTKSIDLKYKQNDLMLELSSNNYILVNKPILRYRLDGFSDKWSTLDGADRKLNFMNMKSGRYTLIVEALSPSDGSLIESAKLNIDIHPPFFLSWYAFLFYIILIVSATWKYIQFSKSKLLLETSLEFEQMEKKHLEEVNQSKLNFFTNISHEFRTPLTLILGQLDLLFQTNNVPPNIYNRILSIKRNTSMMQKLITELLEFRKSEQGHLKLQVSKQDIVKFAYEIYLSFLDFASYKKMNFIFNCKEDEFLIWFDFEQMQKVFYNLISNAFKYTPTNGNIKISIEIGEEYVFITISDNGVGISDDDVSKIFDRFYQAENGLKLDENSHGTGIGLALTKNIVELHHGNISVESKLQLGTNFKVSLKKGVSHFDEKQLVEHTNPDMNYDYQTDMIDNEFVNELKNAYLTNGEPNYTILIVEDNVELCEFLKTVFEPIYKVVIAYDGEDGLSKALEAQPDIILSDLMMPKMTGSDMCAKIKQNIYTCHIPVVLLTAQTAIEHNIEGLQSGADDYITKPFNLKQLIVRCNNLVNGRKILQEKYSKQVDMSARLIASNNLDREFIEFAQNVIEKHIDNQGFDIMLFSQEMSISRTKLFNKIKGITGQTPNEFIFTFKMKKAASLLKNNPELNIFDISCMLGFDTQKYFGKCFKDHFGVSPTAYRNQDKT